MKTIIKDHGHQGPNGGANLEVGAWVRATGERDGGRGVATIEGQVTDIGHHISSGLLRVRVSPAPGLTDVVTATYVWIEGTLSI